MRWLYILAVVMVLPKCQPAVEIPEGPIGEVAG